MTSEDGSWNLDLFRTSLSEDMIQAIQGVPPPQHFEGPDRISWSHTSSGDFSVKSAYKVHNEGDWNLRDEKWKIVWKSPGSHRVRIFIWTILQGRILSNAERVMRGFSDDPSCLICGHHSEDSLHILRDFPEYLGSGRVFLNTDGAVQLDTGIAAARGIVRDNESNWIAGFHRFIGKFSVFDAEIWGILDGLRFVQRRGHDQVIILSNCLEVVKSIIGSSSTSSNSTLIRRIHTILSQETQWILRFIPREQNQVADCLAKQALIEKANMQVFDVPP
ncbi:hypothetical protein PVK06_008512 [Gossypium arboreum]|uniref:Uncharacterized protein n=1 Tax=Gossypium arboreum TaxID=29729 RepID=A0ABR0QK36_GOSAR|nr:hypothetical protein PVK06_008512 [Gossypium arboreum]